MTTFVILLVLLIIYGFFEYRNHQRNVDAIPIRILVNGTRGKSSVTRLITAGLRGNRMLKVMGKTTGTAPRVIFTDGTEFPITRLGRPNIIEQVKVFRIAASHMVDVFVSECMAVLPANQLIMERQMVRSTVGVITNAREDHLDEMGPTVEDVARALANTIPQGAVLYTCEKNNLAILQEAAAKRNTTVTYVSGETMSDEEMKQFSYIEHKENAALALAVCAHQGVPRDKALAEMYRSAPDPGVLRIYRVHHYEKQIEFVNAFAANDPDSYVLIWELLKSWFEKDKKIIVIVNCRKDRIQRSESMANLVAGRIKADYFIFAGEFTTALANRAVELGMSRNKIFNLGGNSGEDIFRKIASLTDTSSIVIGIGNIVGFGSDLITSFKSRGQEIEY